MACISMYVVITCTYLILYFFVCCMYFIPLFSIGRAGLVIVKPSLFIGQRLCFMEQVSLSQILESIILFCFWEPTISLLVMLGIKLLLWYQRLRNFQWLPSLSLMQHLLILPTFFFTSLVLYCPDYFRVPGVFSPAWWGFECSLFAWICL